MKSGLNRFIKKTEDNIEAITFNRIRKLSVKSPKRYSLKRVLSFFR